jgi:ribosomal protein L32
MKIKVKIKACRICRNMARSRHWLLARVLSTCTLCGDRKCAHFISAHHGNDVVCGACNRR